MVNINKIKTIEDSTLWNYFLIFLLLNLKAYNIIIVFLKDLKLLNFTS